MPAGGATIDDMGFAHVVGPEGVGMIVFAGTPILMMGCDPAKRTLPGSGRMIPLRRAGFQRMLLNSSGVW